MKQSKKEKVIAAAGTTIVHLLILLVLFLMAFRTPLPLPSEEGVEVNLGYEKQGYGDDDQSKTDPQSSQQVKQKDATDTKSKEKIVTQDSEDAPAIENENKKDLSTEKKQPQKKEEDPDPKPVVKQEALFKRHDNSQDNGSEGVTEQPGNQGSVNGLTDVKKYEGPGGKGDGIVYDLGGRGHKHLEKTRLEDLSEEGIVVVKIWVNPQGDVIRAEAGAQGTTITDPKIKKKAEEFALASKFNEIEGATTNQYGTITYNFKRDYNK